MKEILFHLSEQFFEKITLLPMFFSPLEKLAFSEFFRQATECSAFNILVYRPTIVLLIKNDTKAVDQAKQK